MGGVSIQTPNDILFKQGFLPSPYDKFLSEIAGYESGQFAGAVPFAQTSVGIPLPPASLLNPPIPGFAPADKSEINFVSDLIAYGAYYAWSAGMVTNYYAPYPGGSGETYMDRETLVGIESNFTRYWPTIQNLEGAAMTNYADCPFLNYDNTAKVNIPILFFGSEFGFNAMGACLTPDSTVGSGQYVAARTATNDITSVILTGYGHLDVYAGTHLLETVKKPMLQWMNDRF